MIPLRSPQDAFRPSSIALGSFDGLHQGHRRVIAAITGQNCPSGCTPTVVSFWPHPREVLHGDTRLRLDLPAEKIALLQPLAVRQLVLIPFDRALASLSPEAFVEQVLVDQLQARRIAVGDNFRFGAGRRGDAQDLARIAAGHGVAVAVLPMLWDGSERVSSSRIRRALAAGELDEARRLLDRPYRFCGQVGSGRGLGRTLGWPTANLQVDGRKFLPAEGVYAAWAWAHQPGSDQADGNTGALAERAARAGTEAPREAMAAVMNLGPQPTVDPQAPSAVEVHLLDRQLNLNGLALTVEPLRLLRSQCRFSGLEELVAQIGRDADQARQICAAIVPDPDPWNADG
ncbi:bifunctional riboflavin kinase/FAD synthetase [Synechococcus sp. CCY9202]|nr:bifunctional riboflavin kinase/FAD synthetase [Synechococcus sp. CCY9202]MEA5423406.1 bifunctional riboflavin kinase/FAD synthetase [Synechococcus sp. CCY9202]